MMATALIVAKTGMTMNQELDRWAIVILMESHLFFSPLRIKTTSLSIQYQPRKLLEIYPRQISTSISPLKFDLFVVLDDWLTFTERQEAR